MIKKLPLIVKSLLNILHALIILYLNNKNNTYPLIHFLFLILQHHMILCVYDCAFILCACIMCMSAGFRRSLRLCRRWRGQAFGTSQFCTLRCPTSCYSSLANPYEEVVQYQHHPEHPHRLIALLGECVSRAKISQKKTHITLCACTLSCMF